MYNLYVDMGIFYLFIHVCMTCMKFFESMRCQKLKTFWNKEAFQRMTYLSSFPDNDEYIVCYYLNKEV